MWLVVDEDNQDSFKAHLFEVPSDFQEHQKNDAFTISNEDVLDWMLNDKGEAYGAYTIRVQRESMNEEEKQEMDEYMGINKYL